MKTTSLKPRLNLFVFLSSSLSVLFCAFFTAFYPKQSAVFLTKVQNFISDNFSWYYMLIIVACLLFTIWLVFSPYGSIKLGDKEEKPEFSYLSWISMLFSAGIGIALVYYGAYEPLEHFFHPPIGLGQTSQAAQQAMVLTFFHWGIHGWALYAFMSVVLAYYTYVEKHPLALRTALYPLFGERVKGWIGDFVDGFGILATIIAMVTNLGIGALLVQEGLAKIFHFPHTTTSLILLIIFMTIIVSIIAIISIEKGIARISEINILLLCLLLGFVFLTNKSSIILDATVQNIGDYLSQFVNLSFNLYSYQNAHEWRGLWTIFFWAWWIAWAPFVSLFIARISKGRTIKELVLGVMFIPLGFTLLWLAIFGNAALDLVFSQNIKALGEAVVQDPQNAIFNFLGYLPYPAATIFLATLTSFVLFFAPVDSGCVMVSNLSMREHENTYDAPKWLRIFWCAATAFITIGLFISNNFMAMQTAVVLCGLPFSLIIILYMISFSKSLKARKTV